MTHDDIIRMAREAGLEQTVSIAPDGSSRIVSCPPIEPLERFANLVAAAEREAFDAKYPIQLTHDQYNVVINAALKDEREACAKLCEWTPDPFGMGQRLSAAIRARREQ